MKVIKRDGRAVEYNSDKIKIAIEKANKEVTHEKSATDKDICKITNYIETLDKKRILVEDIQDIIEQKLMEMGKYELAKKYIVYRYTRALVRKQNTTDESILGLIKNQNIDSYNGSVIAASVQRNLIAGEVSKDLTKRMLLPEKITKAVEQGILIFHNSDYFLQPIINSCVVNVEDILKNGTNINNNKIKSPTSFLEACIVISQVIAAVSSCQYGKQYINIKYFGKFLRDSYDKIKLNLKQSTDNKFFNEDLEYLIEYNLKHQINLGIENINYQINLLNSLYGESTKVAIVIELDSNDEYYKENKIIANEILVQRNTAISNEKTQICCEILLDINDEQDCSNLIELAQKTNCIINPTDIKKYKKLGTFNQGVVSINLIDIVKKSCQNEEIFFNLLNERLEICYEALMCKHYNLLGSLSNVSPIHWQNGAISRLEENEKIDKILRSQDSTITLEYNNIDKITCIMYDCQENNTDSNKLKTKILKYLQDRITKWKKISDLNFELKEDVDM